MDLSFLLNSPDVERVASALETIADVTVDNRNAVHYTEVQSLTDSQKARARSNIGAVAENQGTANAGKIMQVGTDGKLVPTAALDGKVDKTQTVNSKTLNANITLDANDIPYDDDPEAERVVGSVGSALFQRPQYNQVARVDGEQSLTDTQKETARGNIGAASVVSVEELKSAFANLSDSIFNGTDLDEVTNLTMSAGTIHGQNYGNHVTTTDTAYNLTKITDDDYQKLTFNNSIYKVAFVGYSTTGVYQTVGGWLISSPVDLSMITVSGDFWCVQFRRQDGSDLSESDLTNINAMLVKSTENTIVYDEELEPIREKANNATEYVDFVPSGLHRVITNWKLGQIRSNFPNWTASTNKMTTEEPFDIKEGTKIVIAPGYSVIVIRSNGSGTRYNNPFVIGFSDTIWIEVNKTDDTDISIDDRPVSVNIDWRISDTAYVNGSNGNDSNDGSRAYPLKTIMSAVNAGFRTIYVSAGTYTEMVDLRNKYYPISIKLWSMPTYDTSIAEVPKVVIDGQGTRAYGILVENNDRISLENIHCKSCTSAPFYFKNCQYIHCVRCIATDTTGEIMGFSITNADGRFDECEAYNIGKDGFNIHGYGNTEFIDCIAHDCGDDGISHHDGCTGRINGGEFYNCTKGGVASPTYGAYVDVDGVYSHDNTFGIYSVSEDTTRRITKMRISNCALKNNGNVDILFRRATGVMWNTLYDTKTIDADSTLTELT